MTCEKKKVLTKSVNRIQMRMTGEKQGFGRIKRVQWEQRAVVNWDASNKKAS